MYKLIRPLLFTMQPERIHDLVVDGLKMLRDIPLARACVRMLFNYKNPKLEKEVFGVTFKNPIGLAAGFDKNGDVYNDMADFGFGFIEIGSLTPKAQPGNPQPRCFRIPKDEAIINRMGINNKGVKHAVSFIKKHHPNCIIGGSITKGKDTPVEEASKDYEICFEYLYDIVDYIALNVSCPNVKDLYKLQDATNLSEIIDRLLELRRMYDEYRPILLKVSPDIPYTQLDEIIDTILVSGLDGVIATNTTISRDGLKTENKTLDDIGNGGLSGAPLFKKSLAFVEYIARKTQGTLPIIASGGVMTPKQAKQMLDAGASMVQVYSGFIYNGPSFVKKINKYLVKNMK